MLAAVFLWPLGASVVASLTRDGAFTLAHYETVWRLYTRDVLYTSAWPPPAPRSPSPIAIPACGWLRLRAFGPVEFLLKVPLFVPFVVVGHALRVALSPHAPGLAGSWAGSRWPWPGSTSAWPRSSCSAPSAASTRATSRPPVTGRFRPPALGDILVPMSVPALVVSGILIFSSMLASFSIPLMMGRGGGAQMLMIDVYYRYGQHGDFATASALGVVAYLLAMGAALVYVRRLTA